jgi:DNA sulfur modification protein DndE
MSLTTQLLMRRYKSTEDTDKKLTDLARRTGWRDHVITRLAVARSLREAGVPPKVDGARKGKELQGGTLFRWQENPATLAWYVALLTEHHGKQIASDDEAFELLLAHWHRGIELLVSDLADAGDDIDKFILGLARKAAETATRVEFATPEPLGATQSAFTGRIRALAVPIGRYKEDQEPFTITLYDTRKHSNCHLAISGMSGSGKTQLAMQIAASALRQTDATTGMIFIDFAKGDVASNQAFAEKVGAAVFRLPGDVLPVGPFHLREYTHDAICLAAEEKRDVYTNLFRNLGPKQQGRLVQAVRSSYKMLQDQDDPVRAPDFAFVHQVLRDIYDAEGFQPDSLTELFRRLTAYKLFWNRSDERPPTTPLHAQRWIVDIHELGGLKEVTAFTLIEQLYREMRSLPESEVDNETGLRHIRCLLFIDEAQYYLGAKNKFLQGLIREGRSKGFAVILLCQSPDDFEQSDFDYTEQLEFTFMLNCKTEAKAVQRLLGTSLQEAKKLATDLGRMEPLHGIGRGNQGRGEALLKFRIVPFFEVADRI